MPISHDEGNEEAANLMQAFNACADGFEATYVLTASLNLAAAVIIQLVRDQGGDLADAEGVVEDIGGMVLQTVRDNWGRKPLLTDIPVKANG